MKNLTHIIKNHLSCKTGIAISVTWISRDVHSRSVKKEIIGKDLTAYGGLLVNGSIIALIASALGPKIFMLTWVLPIVGITGMLYLGVRHMQTK